MDQSTLEAKLDLIDAKLDVILKQLDSINQSAANMDTHINFVDSVFEKVKDLKVLKFMGLTPKQIESSSPQTQ